MWPFELISLSVKPYDHMTWPYRPMISTCEFWAFELWVDLVFFSIEILVILLLITMERLKRFCTNVMVSVSCWLLFYSLQNKRLKGMGMQYQIFLKILALEYPKSLFYMHPLQLILAKSLNINGSCVLFPDVHFPLCVCVNFLFLNWVIQFYLLLYRQNRHACCICRNRWYNHWFVKKIKGKSPWYKGKKIYYG